MHPILSGVVSVYRTSNIASNKNYLNIFSFYNISVEGDVRVEGDGYASDIIVNSGGHIELEGNSGGECVNNTTINLGGSATVFAGGVASNTTINGGLHVEAGGSAVGGSVNSDGGILVDSGGALANFTVNSGGGITVIGGGTLTSGTVSSGGILNDYLSGAGDDLSKINILSGADISLDITAGASVSNQVISGLLHIESGGKATGLELWNFGDIENGVVAIDTIIESHNLTVDSGGYNFDSIILSSADEIVNSGGITVDPIISGGYLELAGPTAAGQIFTFSGSGGTVVIDNIGSNGALFNNFGDKNQIYLSNVELLNSEKLVDGELIFDTAISGTITLRFPGFKSLGELSIVSDGGGIFIGTNGPTITDYLLASELAYDETLDPNGLATLGYETKLNALGYTLANVAGNIDASGMAAEAFVDSATHDIIVAFRGTVFPGMTGATLSEIALDLGELDGIGIFGPSPSTLAPVFASAYSYVESVEAAYQGDTVYVTGHSLGGAEAEAVAAALTASASSSPDTFGGGDTFAAPGVTALLGGANSGWTQPTTTPVSTVTNYVITTDPVGAFASDVGSTTNNSGNHVSPPTLLNPVSLGFLKSAAVSAAAWWVNTTLPGKLLNATLLIAKNISLSAALQGMFQHPLSNYADALVNAGKISTNPLSVTSSTYSLADLASLFSSISNNAVSQAGNTVIESGVVNLNTALGTATVNLSETSTGASATLSMVIQSGANTASQTLTESASGITDAIQINGAQIMTADLSDNAPASLDVTSDGSLVVSIGDQVSGDEVTIDDSPTNQATIYTGGDADSAQTQVAQVALPTGTTLKISQSSAGTVASLSPTLSSPMAADLLNHGASDYAVQNLNGQIWIGEARGGHIGYVPVGNPGLNWTYEGAGDLLGDGNADILLRSTTGSIVVGEVVNGALAYTAVGALDSSWTFEGLGDVLGDGRIQFLVENSSGSVVAAEVINGQAAYTQIATLGGQWSFVGVGDFLDLGSSQFLIENPAGALLVGQVVNGQASYSQVATLASGYTVEVTGDFMGDGKADVLVQSAAGLLLVGEVVNGAMTYTAVSALASGWSFKGAGDYLGDGRIGFLLQDRGGDIVVGEVINGAAAYTQVSALGSQWDLLQPGVALHATRTNLLGDGVSDVLVENTGGLVLTGEVSGGQLSYSAAVSLAAAWTFQGTGDFEGDGRSQVLLDNSATGAVVVGAIANGQTAFVQVGALTSNWSFRGVGDLLGDGRDQFLIENTAGTLLAGEVDNGQVAYSVLGALGSQWAFKGVGDLLGDGRSQFLLQNTASGAVLTGEVGANGQASYAQVGILGAGWSFEGVGDLLGDGKDQFLLENTSGAVLVGEVGANGQASYMQVALLAAQWQFIGVGDYGGTGVDGFMIQNSASGALLTGSIVNGQALYAQVGALSAQWTVHS